MEAAFGQVFPFSHSEARSRQAAKRKIRIKKFNKVERARPAHKKKKEKNSPNTPLQTFLCSLAKFKFI